MLYGFASGTVACEATVSSRSLPLGTFSARDERDSGEKVPRGEEWRETAVFAGYVITWEWQFWSKVCPARNFPSSIAYNSEFYLNILYSVILFWLSDCWLWFAFFIDIDECATGMHKCTVHDICNNTHGSHNCTRESVLNCTSFNYENYQVLKFIAFVDLM